MRKAWPPFKAARRGDTSTRRSHSLFSPRFDSAAPFSDGLAGASEKGVYCYINHTGHYLIARFKYAEDFAEARRRRQSRVRPLVHRPQRTAGDCGEVRRRQPLLQGIGLREATIGAGKDESIYNDTFACIDWNGKRVFTYRKVGPQAIRTARLSALPASVSTCLPLGRISPPRSM